MPDYHAKEPALAKCIIPECNDDVHYIHLQVCKACYSGLANWRGRSRHDKEFRLQRCKRLVERMDFILDHPRHAPKRMKKR